MNSRNPLQWDFTLAAQGLHKAWPAPGPVRLLLVDDEPIMLESLEALLSHRGFELVSASSGVQAITLLGAQRFDVLVLDLGLPDINGLEVMGFIRQRQIDTHVIIASGDSSIQAAIGALRNGAYDYLRKPYPREELLKAVQNALQQRRLTLDNRYMTWQLERSERVYRYLVDSSPDIIFILNPRGELTFVNNRVHPLLGFTPEDLLGKPFAALVHPHDAERLHYVMSDGLRSAHWSRNIELRLHSQHSEDEARIFSIDLISVAFTRQDAGPGAPPPDDADVGEPLGMYGVARDITDKKRAEELIAYQAYYDILTDLPNRVMFKDRLNLALLQAKRKQQALAVMFVDLDRFKLINDSLGHQLGDDLLRQVTRRLKTCLRHSDTLSRFGSDEFNVVLPDLDSPQDPARVAQAFLAALRTPFELNAHTVHVTASIGMAVYPRDGGSVDELVRNADLAMHVKKSQGRDGYMFFEPSMYRHSFEQITLEQDLRRALQAGELEMFYQPQVDGRSGRIIGAEALMRWNHPRRGFLSPASFLPLAEESGLILPISDWMLEAVCRDLLAWNAVVGQGPYLSINLSPQYLDRGDCFDRLQSVLARHHIPPGQLEVEITENICIRNPLAAIEQLRKLGQLGVRVAIDDFGTGYSSLAYLQQFPIHVLKIDRSFVIPIEDEGQSFPVILAIISIAKGLGLKLVAEGVETEAQQRYLAQAGCQTFQGYYYHRPMPQASLLELLGGQPA